MFLFLVYVPVTLDLNSLVPISFLVLQFPFFLIHGDVTGRQCNKNSSYVFQLEASMPNLACLYAVPGERLM